MSIIIQIGPSHLATSSSVAPHPACIVEAETTLDMGPDLEYDAEAPVTSVDTSNVTLSTTVTTNHSRKEVRSNHHVSHGFASCFGLPYQDHNYGAPPPPSPPQSPLPKVNGTTDDDTSFSVISTSTNNEDDTQEESITRCICGFDHDDEYMICCDRCSVWQHVDCMGLNQSNIPDTYLCEKCEPRKVDRQKAKALQTRKKEAMTDSTTDDSGEEENHSNSLQTDNKTIKLRKRRKDSKNVNKSDIGLMMKRYKIKGNKERVERTRTGIRKKTKSESTSTADEEAQDAWESSLCEWSFKYEEASVNQYTPEIQLLAGSLGTRNNDAVKKINEQLLVQLCKVVDISGKKRLVAAADVPQNQVITEYKGKFLSATHFCEQNPIFNNRLYPYVLFFKMDKHSDICVDAREYGNDARFVRRSCTPNAEVKPLINSGVLHIYLFSLKEIKKDEEVTISYDHSYAECPSERRKKSKKAIPDIENDSSQTSLAAGNSVIPSSPCKSQKYSPIKSVNYQSTPISHSVTPADSTLEYTRIGQEENDTDEQSAERRKMTREERKIDAIMRAFERMEKTAKRRQQALERMAQQKAQLQKQDSEKDSPDVLDGISDQIVGEEDGSNLQSIEVPCNEELKSSLITCQNNSIHGCRHRKGKRRRGSGTPSRRRTRSNSGGSDIMSPDELAPMVVNPISLNSTVSPTNPSTSISTSSSSVSPSATACNNSNTFPKTKKFLMQEWLQEKAETSVPVSCPLTIHTELSWNLSTASPTCYVRCTRDSPNVGGISSAHLRRNSTSGLGLSTKPTSLGSAKKRWLRQAMCESGTSEVDCSNFETTILEGGPNSPLHNGCFSPNPHSDASSPCLSPPGDIVTPLKKRRLMRESLESMSSPRSPSPTVPIGWPASISSIESPEHSNSALEERFLHLNNEEKILQSTARDDDETSIINSGQNGVELLEPAATNSTEQWTVKEESSDMEPTSSSGVNQDVILNNEKEASPNASDIPSINATASDSSQGSSCLDLTCHDDRESHVSSSESTVPINRFQNNVNLLPVNNVSSSTLNDNNEVTSTNKELSPVEDDKDSLPDSSLGGEIELGNRSIESEICSVQQEQPLGKSNSTNDCVTSSHFVNTINDKQASSSSYTVPYSSIKSAQTIKLPVRIFPASSCSNSTSISSCSSLVSSSVSQKRKVSLSEYRMRMREQANISDSKTIQKTSETSPVKSEETSNVQDPSSTMCPIKFSLPSKISEKTSSKRKDCMHKEEYQSGELDVRWNNDQPEISSEQEMQSEADSAENIDAAKESEKSQDQNMLLVKPVSNTTSILQMCAQPPPPPPLPSSSSSSPAKPSTVPQFRYPTAQPYCRQPFIVGQVSSPFVALPPSLSPTLPAQTSIHVMHHPTHILPPPPPPPIIPVPQSINPPATSAFPTPPPPPQPLPQNGYNSVVSSQNFIPSAIPQSYHYNQGLFK